MKMIATEAIKAIMSKQGVKGAALADRIKVKYGTLRERLTQKNVSIGKLEEMARALDYKVLLVPRDTKLPDGGYEIE